MKLFSFLGVMVHNQKPTTLEVETGELSSLRPASAIKQVQDQLMLYETSPLHGMNMSL